MTHIFVKNVYSTITDLENTAELDTALSCYSDGYNFSKAYRDGVWDGKYHFFKPLTGKVPTGLLPMVEAYLVASSVQYAVTDQRPLRVTELKPYDKLNGITLRDYQIAAIETALEHGRGILEMGTGSGKTEVAVAITKALDQKTLFLVNTKDLLYQAKDRFELRLGTKCGMIGDSEREDGQIVISTTQSMWSAVERFADKAKKYLNEFKVLFMDESHHSSANTFYKVGMFMHNACWRFGLSGTALRRDVLSNMKAIAVLGDVIYRLPSATLIKDGVLSDVEIIMIKNAEEAVGYDWQDIYAAGIVNSFARNTLISHIAREEFRRKSKVMILVKHIEHGQNLIKQLGELGVPTKFLHGEHDAIYREETKREFNCDGEFVLVASPIYDEGVDIPEMNVLIAAGGGQSEIKVIQHVGRGLRKKQDGSKLKVYDFIDKSKYLRAHSKSRIKIYKQEGFCVKEI